MSPKREPFCHDRRSDGRTLLFALIALVVRSAVLYPALGGMGLSRREAKTEE
jgi:hypothetical protein